ncbi:chemotaxis protein CheW [Desulfosporosinus sp. HMP52]|uniref:chemotaxis protein CheW n=1 Tax=Desulfosporosinus sp. HMP52 TaxID=1487923 RepID=UPI00051FC01A|nr:chemotaxis protein CheW [Desulfosporosinus sp. HMP52]KGK88692.1 chemotaxis protein CheW [Desulfosporosinus sp. HMP52]
MADIVEQEALDMVEDTQKGKFLTFCMGNEYYGIEIKYVTEIIGLQPITEIPEMPEYIKGIINLRGKIIPVMDVRLRFKKPYRAYNDRTCIVVIEIRAVSIGLIVDSVSEVIAISDEEIVTPPNVAREGNRYIKGIGKVGSDVKLLLDSDRLLNETELETVNDL